MWAWLVAIVVPVLKPIGAWLVGVFTKDLVAWLQDLVAKLVAKWEADRVAKENLQKYKDALKTGDQNEISKAGSDLLNGHKP